MDTGKADMTRLRTIFVAVFIMMLFGCAAPARIESMVPAESLDGLKFDTALEKSVFLKLVEGGEETNPIWLSKIGNEEFGGALEMSLQQHGLSVDSGKGKYELSVRLLEVDAPSGGLNMKVTTYVKYKLTNDETGEVILSKEVIAPYTATMGDSLYGVNRLRLANEGSVKKNIEEFLVELSKLEIQAD